MRALVIDDSRAMRLILARILQEAGFEGVEQAATGREGIGRLCESPYDVVLVDWSMPDMGGLEFVRSVRSQRTHDHVPVVMVTTATELEQIGSALTAGANEYILKPFTADVLADKLRLAGVPPR